MDYLTFVLWFSFVWRCLCVAKERKSAVSRLPPGPATLPIIGSLLKAGNNISHESLAKLANIHGPIMSLKLGSSITVVVSSSSIAKQILQKYDQVSASRTVPDALRASKHNESSIIWLPSSSHHWRTIRKISNSHMFSSQRVLEANQGLRHQKMKDLLAYVRESSQVGRSVDIGEAAFTTVLNLIANIMFSMDLAKINSKSAFEFKALVRGVMEEAVDIQQ